MKIVQFDAFGPPHEVAACIEAPEPKDPGPDEVLVEIEAFPLNPADLLTLEGRYALRPALPATLGAEGLGRVVACGSAVRGLAPGDRVLHLGRDNWVQRLTAKAAALVKVPADLDPLQLAMLKVNPATALLMLRGYVTLAPGDWLLQDAANSGVGTCVIRLATAAGLKTVNVVRRAELIEPLRALGADVVLLDGPDLAERVRAETGGAEIRLGLDAVAGPLVDRLAACLAEGGTLVNYGLLSGEPCRIDPHQLVFRGITLTGFWLAKTLSSSAPERIHSLYEELIGRLRDGTLGVPVEATYPIEEIKAALEHAGREGRGGKVLVTPNGPLAYSDP
ncbi:MAG TPA: zinc-dependent alcohol dehydrogenase family protein [Kiloniellales bacterium]|nr:zinc-dependent alcohol dehydrogenase family protein [Kiloniellales bacterium]